MPSCMEEHASLDLLRMFVCLARSKERCELLAGDDEPTRPEIDHKLLVMCNCTPRSDQTVMYSETRQVRYALRYMKEVGNGTRPPPTKAQWKKFSDIVNEQLGELDKDDFEGVSDMDGDDSDDEGNGEQEEEDSEDGEQEKEEAEDEAEGEPAGEPAEDEEEEEGEEEDADDDFQPAEDDGEEGGEEEEGEEDEEEDDEEEEQPAKRKRA